MSYRKGDILIGKTNSNDFSLTKGKDYKITRIGDDFIYIMDDRSCERNYSESINSIFYIGYFFHTKSELRIMKLKELGI
jgi:hypothetical protein